MKTFLLSSQKMSEFFEGIIFSQITPSFRCLEGKSLSFPTPHPQNQKDTAKNDLQLSSALSTYILDCSAQMSCT